MNARLTGRRTSAWSLVALACALPFVFIFAFDSRPAWAQSPRPAVAVYGEPFGVFVAEVPVPQGLQLENVRVLVDDDQNRIFYPATAVRTMEVVEPPPPLPGRLRPGGLIDRMRNVIRGERSRRVAVAIVVAGLFRGEGPLELKLAGDVNQKLTVTPTAGGAIAPPPAPVAPGVPAAAAAAPNAHRALLEDWWRVFAAQVERVQRTGDHPQLLHEYLVHMLSQRLDLPWPLPKDDPDAEPPRKKKFVEPLGTLALLSGIEPLRDEILEQTLSQPADDGQANLPLPAPPEWLPLVMPQPPANVSVESLATRVPPECFYLRFGSFANYLWFQDLSARSGGDLAQIVLVRGFNYETTQRMEHMLNTRLTAVARMFGDRIISDMAIVGRDLYMKEGASLGVLFETSNKSLLISSLESERRQALDKFSDATVQTVKIAGKDVSLLSTPDNRIRSFLVADGNHVFLTTSRNLAERFLQTGDGEPSLASTDAFRWARVWMPGTNNYSVFAFFSPDFFHGLVSPQYQIELHRRLEAIAHLEVAEVASRAAEAEGVAQDIPALKSSGLLPPWFDERADGARTLRTDDKWIDSLRGARGSFLPIVDVEVTEVSPSEAARYTRLADFYGTKWQQMDPMMFALRRFQAEGDPQSERIALEAYMAPFAREKYGWIADLLAPAAPVAIATPPDDVISVQALMNGTAPLAAPRQPYHLFGGIKDMVPPSPGDTKGLIKTFRALRAAPAYLGAYPRPGYLDQLPLGFGAAVVDPAGFARSFIGLWRWQGGGFSVLSFDRSILENVLATLAPVKVEDSAQVRLTVRNLSGSRLSGWINDQWYERAARASHGNAALFDAIHQQLKVPGPEALSVAETMLDVRLNCPMGGKFVFTPQSPGSPDGWWTSTAWASEVQQPDGTIGPPPDYIAPWLKWFRGSELHLTQLPDRVAVVGTVDVERQPLPPEAVDETELPTLNFDLFQLPFKMFGGGEQAAPSKPEKRKF